MRCVTILATVLLVEVLCTKDLPADPPRAFPEYVDQAAVPFSLLHSGICTFGGGVVWDFQLDDMVQAALNPAGEWDVDDAHFAFLECYGGGMIDEVAALGIPLWSATSAARHFEWAWAGNDPARPRPPAIAGVESGYGLWWAETVAGGMFPPFVPDPWDSGLVGFTNDLFGPVRLVVPLERPQYTSNGPVADAIFLADAPANTRVILFGGSKNEPGNWNSLSRIHDALVIAGMAEANMHIMYPGFGVPGQTIPDGAGTPFPAWIDANTTFADMGAAWVWLRAQLAAMDDAQVLFWSSWGHGTRCIKLEIPVPIFPNIIIIIPISEPADAAAERELRRKYAEDHASSPKIQVQCDRNPGNLSLKVNDVIQPPWDTTSLGNGTYQFWFQVADDASFEALVGTDGGVQIELGWDDEDPLNVSLFGLTSGVEPNAISAPSPIPAVSEWGLIVVTLLGLTVGTVVLGRRRRTAAV